jgi:hypothetical protein
MLNGPPLSRTNSSKSEKYIRPIKIQGSIFIFLLS